MSSLTRTRKEERMIAPATTLSPFTAFGTYIRDRRTAQHMAIGDVAAAIDVPLEHVERIERGQALPALSRIAPLAQILRIAPSEIVTRMSAYVPPSKDLIASSTPL